MSREIDMQSWDRKGRKIKNLRIISDHGQLGMALAFPPIDVGGGNFTTVLGVKYVG
jgi:hypothetical protein